MVRAKPYLKIDNADIVLHSLEKGKIKLPFHGKINDDLMVWIEEALIAKLPTSVLDRLLDDFDDISNFLWNDQTVRSYSIVFNIQPQKMRLFFYVEAVLPEVGKITAYFPVWVDISTCTSILDSYFHLAEGAHGLYPSSDRWFRESYATWKNYFSNSY